MAIEETKETLQYRIDGVIAALRRNLKYLDDIRCLAVEIQEYEIAVKARIVRDQIPQCIADLVDS